MTAELSPYDRWIIACETRDGVLVRDPATGVVLNPEVKDITPEEAEAAVLEALHRFHLSEPTSPYALRCAAATALGEPMPPPLSAAEADRQGLL